MLSDEVFLLSRWLRKPATIGAIAPSGKHLARAMAAAVSDRPPGMVMEFGGGTGAVTQALLASGVVPEDLMILEHDEELHRYLRRRFPQGRVLYLDVLRARESLDRETLGPVSAVVSSLPLLAMSQAERRGVLTNAFDLMTENGIFVQFTYGPKSPVSPWLLRSLGLEGEAVARVWRNLPPATVWRYRRIGAPRAEEAARQANGLNDLARAPGPVPSRAARAGWVTEKRGGMASYPLATCPGGDID